MGLTRELKEELGLTETDILKIALVAVEANLDFSWLTYFFMVTLTAAAIKKVEANPAVNKIPKNKLTVESLPLVDDGDCGGGSIAFDHGQIAAENLA